MISDIDEGGEAPIQLVVPLSSVKEYAPTWDDACANPLICKEDTGYAAAVNESWTSAISILVAKVVVASVAWTVSVIGDADTVT